LSRKKAFAISSVLASVLKSNPACFEGEDLSVAYALEERLRTWGTPLPAGSMQTQEMLSLSSDEERVVAAAEACQKALPFIPTKLAPGTPQVPGAPSKADAILPTDDSLPLLPIAVAGIGLVGVIAALLID
jgi:hypothetical protein